MAPNGPVTHSWSGRGRGGVQRYAHPKPVGFGDTQLRTPQALYDKGLEQFILRYDPLRQSPNPDEFLPAFLLET